MKAWMIECGEQGGLWSAYHETWRSTEMVKHKMVGDEKKYMFEKHVQPTGDLNHERPSPFSKKANSVD
jgi:hypothetical protein